MRNDNGALVISLDFELLWGVFDKFIHKDNNEYFLNTRNVIPEILRLFEQYGISCTWATVGMLFNENWDEWESNFPEILPEYYNIKLSAYEFGKSIRSTKTEALCFAPNIIRKIISTPNQEIATHTYSHYYCLESGQNLESFNADLKKFKELASNFGAELKSLVFPRNQFNQDYLKACYNSGIRNVRSNPIDWYWRDTEKDSLIRKVFRTGDAYAGGFNKTYKFEDIESEIASPRAQKASRLLRPHAGNFLDGLKLNRIKSEMLYAARNNEIYHLWWHPHNFGNNPEKNITELIEILKCFKTCNEKYNFQSESMDSIGNISIN